MTTSLRGPTLASRARALAARHLRPGRREDTGGRLADGLAATEWPRAERARALLQEAETRLRDAKRHLAAQPPDYAATLADELAVVRASLGAFLTWGGSAPVNEGADVLALAGRAVRLAGVFRLSPRRRSHPRPAGPLGHPSGAPGPRRPFDPGLTAT